MFTIECQVERTGKDYFNYFIYLLRRKDSYVVSEWCVDFSFPVCILYSFLFFVSINNALINYIVQK